MNNPTQPDVEEPKAPPPLAQTINFDDIALKPNSEETSLNNALGKEELQKILLEAEEKDDEQNIKNTVLRQFAKPDVNRLNLMLAAIHPRDVDREKDGKLYSKPYECGPSCKFTTGSNCFCSTQTEYSKIEQYGPAMTFYFRHSKTTLWFLFICCIIQTVLVYLYNEAYKASKAEDTTVIGDQNMWLQLRDWSLSSSIGGYAYGSTKFFEANFTNIFQLNSTTNNITNNDPNIITFGCEQGTLDMSEMYTFYGLIDSRFYSSYTFYMYVKDINNDPEFRKSVNPCNDKKKCNVTYSNNWFKNDAADYVEGTNGNEKHKLYIKYHCKDIQMAIFSMDYLKSYLNYIVLIVNGITLIFFLIYLLSWKWSETAVYSYFRESRPLPSDYTIKLKNLPQNFAEEELKTELYNHLMKYRDSLAIRSECIVDINIAKDNDILYLDQTIKRDEMKITSIVHEMIENGYVPKPDEGIIDAQYIINYKNNNKDSFSKGKNKRTYQAFFKTLKHKQKIEGKRVKALQQKNHFLSAFITFNTNINKVKYFNAMSLSQSKYFNLKCCPPSDHMNLFQNNVLRVNEPSEPANIVWENLQVSPVQKRARRFLSWVITIALVIVPLIVVIYISLSLKNQETFKLSCPDQTLFTEESIKARPDLMTKILKDFSLKERSENLAFCYCYTDFRGRYYKKFEIDGKERQMCKEIYTSIITQVVLSAIMAIILTFCSLVINFILRLLSVFERHSNLNEMYKSRIVKGFLLRYMTTAALTIFINIRISLPGDKYVGDYDDFTPNWFKNIGYSLGLTLFLRIIASIATSLLKAAFLALYRCYDRSFSVDMAKTKQKIHDDYESIYTNPEFELDFCYTEMISVLFVVMTLAPFLPYIFYIAFVYLFILYWKDKLVFLMGSRIPPQFDEGMSRASRAILSYAIPVYLIFCIWIFGNINILDETDSSYARLVRTQLEKTYNFEGFFGPFLYFILRCFSGNAIYFTTALILYIIGLILYFFLGGVLWGLLKCLCCCFFISKKELKVKKNTHVHFCWRVPNAYIADELKLAKKDEEQGIHHPESITRRLQKLRLREYEQFKLKQRQNTQLRDLNTFSTLPSYDYRLNQQLRELFLH